MFDSAVSRALRHKFTVAIAALTVFGVLPTAPVGASTLNRQSSLSSPDHAVPHTARASAQSFRTAQISNVQSLGRGLEVSWLPGTTTAKSYELSAVPANGGPSKSWTFDGEQTSAVLSSLTPKQPYSLSLLSIFISGTKVISTYPFTAFPLPATAPKGFVATNAYGLDSSISVAWSAPSYDGGDQVLDYTLRATSPGLPTAEARFGRNSLGGSIDGLVNGHEYQVKISAANDIGATSFTLTAVPTATPAPSVPGSLSVAPNEHGSLSIAWHQGENHLAPATVAYKLDVADATTGQLVQHVDLPETQRSFVSSRLNERNRYVVTLSSVAGDKAEAKLVSRDVTPKVLISQRTIVLDDRSEANISMATTNFLLARAPLADQLRGARVGSILAAGQSRLFPRGLLAQVSSIERSGSLVAFSLTPTSLSSATPYLSASNTIALAPQLSTVPLATYGAGQVSHAIGSVSFPISGTVRAGGVSATVAVTPTLILGVNASLSDVNISATASLTASLSLEASFEDSQSATIFNSRFKTFTIYVDGFPIVITPTIDITTDISANGSIEISTSASASAIATWDSNTGFQVSMSSSFSGPTYTGSASLSGSLDITPGLVFYDVGGPSITIEGKITATAKNTDPFFKIDAEADVWATISIDKDFEKWGVTLFSIHASASTPPLKLWSKTLLTVHAPPSGVSWAPPTGSVPGGSSGGGSWPGAGTGGGGGGGSGSTWTPRTQCSSWGSATPICHIYASGGFLVRYAPQIGATTDGTRRIGDQQTFTIYCQVMNGDRVGYSGSASHHWYYGIASGVGSWIADAYTDTPIVGETSAPGVARCSSESGVPPEAPVNGGPSVPNGYVPISVGSPPSNGSGSVNYVAVPNPVFNVSYAPQGLYRRSCPHLIAKCQIGYGPGAGQAVQLWCQVLDGDLIGSGGLANNHWYYATWNGKGTWVPDYYLNTPITGNTPLGGVAFCSTEDGGPPEGAASGAQAPVDLGTSATGHVYPVVIVTSNAGLWDRSCPHLNGTSIGQGCVINYGPGAGAAVTLYCQVQGDSVNGDTTWYFGTFAGGNGQGWVSDYYVAPQSNNVGPCSNQGFPPPEFIGPQPPQNVTLTPVLDGLTVSWQPGPPNTAGNPSSNYIATAQPGGASCSSASGNTCTIGGLNPDTTYTITMQDQNWIGYSGTSTPVQGTPLGVPSAPLNVSLQAGLSQLAVSWSVPTSNGGTPILSYQVIAQPGGATCSTAGTQTCTLTGLVGDGTVYSVSVTATNAQGSSPPSIPAKGQPWQRPSAPASVALQSGPGSLTITWPAVVPTDGSTILHYTAVAQPGGLSCTTNAPSTSCAIGGLKSDGTAYSVSVFATNAVGDSQLSPSAIGYSFMAPQAPTAPTLVPGINRITVSWVAPTGGTPWVGPAGSPVGDNTGGTPITGYYVLAQPGNEFCTAVAPATSCVLSGLSFGTTYSIQVEAQNAVGFSAPSASSSAQPFNLPSAPTNVTASGGNAAVSVQWTATPDANNGGSAITGYLVTAEPGGETCTTSGSSATSCTLTGLTSATQYAIWVQAQSDVGFSTPTSPTIGNTFSIPSEPTNFQVTGLDGKLHITWGAPSLTGGTPITGYAITVTDGVHAFTCQSPLSPASTSCDVAGLQNGSSYAVTLVAQNVVGNSYLSLDQAPGEPNPTTPDPPSLTVTKTIGGLNQSSATVSLAAPSNTGGASVTDYTVVATDPQSGNVVGTLPLQAKGSTLVGNLTKLTLGATYKLQAFAHNSVGWSGGSNTAVVTPLLAPSVVDNVVATPGNSSIVVSWAAPASSGGSAITSYVATATGGKSPVTCIWTNGPLTCTITGLKNGTTYKVSVVAQSAGGTSPASAPVLARPAPVAPKAPVIQSAVPQNGQIVVSLAPYDQSGNGGSPVGKFTVAASASSGLGRCAITAPSTSCSLSGLKNGVAYSVTATATSDVGLTSLPSQAQKATPFTLPAAPTTLTFVLTATSAALSWKPTPQSSNGGSPVVAYNIVVTGPSAPPMLQVNGATTSKALVTGLLPGKQYSFAVYAVNQAGPSTTAASIQVVLPILPPAPKAVAAKAGAGLASVTWTAPTSNGGSPITGYIVTALPSQRTCTWSSGPLSCTVTGLPNGVPTTFVVQTENVNGVSMNSAPSASVTPVTTPDAPSITQVVSQNQAILVSWSLPSFSGGTPVVGSTAQVVGAPTLSCFSVSTSCTIRGLNNGVSYSIEVLSTNSQGQGSGAFWSTPVVPSTVPDPPKNVLATALTGGATVSWSAPAFDEGSVVTTYVVTAQPGGSTCTWTSGPLTCSVLGLTNATSYSFTVVAGNANGLSTAGTSNNVTPATVPGAPTGVVGTSFQDGSSLVTWQAPGSNGGGAITQYVVTAQPGGSTCTWNSGPLSCVVPTLVDGATYTFTVTATNWAGTSPPSSASSSVTPAAVPGVVLNVAVQPVAGGATVTWNAPQTTGGAPITGYQVSASPGGASCSWVSGPLTCTVTGLTNGMSYTFAVIAENGAGSSIANDPTAPVTPRTVPSSPTSVSVAFGNQSAIVSWSASALDGGSPITSYLVLDSTGVYTCSAPSTATSCVVHGLTNGTTYTFTVVAVNVAGPSPAASAGSVTPSTTPGAPTITTVVAGNSQVTVTWQEPTSTGGAPITQYLISASPGGSTCTWVSGPLICTVVGLSNGTNYTFTVVAVNQSGSGLSSSASSVVSPQNTPSAPTGILVTPGVTSVLVTWSAPTAGAAVTGYVVTASPGGATCTPSPATSLSCSFTNLTPGTTYTFSVVASSAYGMGPASMPSASVLMPVVPGTPTNVSLQAGDGSLVVGWTSPSQNGGAPITSYIATAQPGGATCTSAQSPCTITGLSNGTNYTVTVRALNGVGSSAASSPSSGAIPSGLPGIPNNVYQSDNSQSAIRMQWSDANNNGASITQYQAQTNTGASCIVGAGQGDTCVIPNLPAGSSFTCYVRAMNANGWGGWSGGVGCNTQNPPPPPTTNVYKGGSFYASWCRSNCRFIGFSLSNFSANTTYSVQLCDSVDGSCDPSVTGWSAITITTDGAGNFSMTTNDVFGYSGAVWAHVVGVASNENHLTW